MESLAASVQSDHRCMQAIHRDEKVGYCVLLNNGLALEILHIVVFSEYQQLRLGTMMLDAICVLAKQSGLTALWLEVRDENLPALALYRSYGFIEQGRRKNYYCSADAINMTYML